MSIEREKARRAALKMLERRAYSARELAQRLARRGHDDDPSEQAVSALVASGVVDDRALGESVVRAELARVPAGRALLEMKLVKRGIDRELAAEIVRGALCDRASEDDAEAVARRHLKSLAPTLELDAVRRRLFGKLSRRGFSPEVARGAVERVTREMSID